MSARWWWLLRAASALCCMGLAIEHWFGDPPYRSLLWDQKLMEPIVGWLGWSWQAWAGGTAISKGIDQFASLLGWGFGLAALAVLVPMPGRRRAWTVGLAVAVGLLLVPLGLARWAAHGYAHAWPPEFMLRAALPLLILVAQPGSREVGPTSKVVLLVACAATYIGHGCCALG